MHHNTLLRNSRQPFSCRGHASKHAVHRRFAVHAVNTVHHDGQSFLAPSRRDVLGMVSGAAATLCLTNQAVAAQTPEVGNYLPAAGVDDFVLFVPDRKKTPVSSLWRCQHSTDILSHVTNICMPKGICVRVQSQHFPAVSCTDNVALLAPHGTCISYHLVIYICTAADWIHRMPYLCGVCMHGAGHSCWYSRSQQSLPLCTATFLERSQGSQHTKWQLLPGESTQQQHTIR